MQETRKQTRGGFTVVELLVVLATLSILAAILFPVFAAARATAWQIVCLSNQRQLAHAFVLYAQDYDESLPFFGDQFPHPRVFWPELLRPYLRSERVLECPSWPKSGKYRNQQGILVAGQFGIGANYGKLLRYAVLWRYVGRPTMLNDLAAPSQTMLLTDSQGSRHVYSPLVWRLTVDWNQDGVRDSSGSVLWGEGPFNRGDPYRHRGGANCTFADGHARWIEARSWLGNRGDLWGGTGSPDSPALRDTPGGPRMIIEDR